MTRLLIVALLILSVSGCTAWKEPKHQVWKTATGAEQHERLMWQAIQDKDWPGVEQHLAASFAGVDAEGKQLDRAGWVEHWKTAEVTEFSLGEVLVQPGGADMVVTYELHLVATGHAQPPKGLRVISVWQELKKGWVLISQSSTPVL
jgi:hypothetical protein